jgi:hypothetical protein
MKSWLRNKLLGSRTSEHKIIGLRTIVVNTRPDIATSDVIARLSEALELIREHTPHYFRHLCRDFSHILVQRYACRGAYLPTESVCLVELTFVVNPAFSPAQIAATILHEAMHARLHRLGFAFDVDGRARQERFCRRAEIEFGAAVPGGEPVVERAVQALSLSDENVAPQIDPRLAAHRIAQVDAAAKAPGWLRKAARRRSESGADH